MKRSSLSVSASLLLFFTLFLYFFPQHASATESTAHEHQYGAVITAPTCSTEGYTIYTCACGDCYVTDHLDATGKHTYKNGICKSCGSSVLELGYVHAVPENQGVQNALDRAYLLTDTEWTPVADVPGVQKINSVYTVVPFVSDLTYQGIPYSGVTYNDCYVGLNVSLESFLTALKNKNSVLYTENLSATNPKAATYFGTVCSKFAQYVLDIPGSYNTTNMPYIPGMETIALPHAYTIDQIKLGDVILDPDKHAAVCTDILYDADGNVAYIEISEAVLPRLRRMLWSPQEFFSHFSSYGLYRYQLIDQVSAQKAPDVDKSYALMPRFGDKYNYKVSDTEGIVDILESGYSRAVIYRNGRLVKTVTLHGATTFTFDQSIPGHLEMYLEKDDGTRSGSVYAWVVDASISVTDCSRFAFGELTVNIDGSSGTPLYVQVSSAHAVFCDLQGQEGTVNLLFSTSRVTNQKVRVAYQNEYGIYLSDWVTFVAKENISDDPLLSLGTYWNEHKLTSSKSTPILQEGISTHYSYTQVPVEGKTTYDAQGATRVWFFDKNGNAISSCDPSRNENAPFRFTTPKGTTYVNLSYSMELIEKGQEALVHPHSYRKNICTECGHPTPYPYIKPSETTGPAVGQRFAAVVK